MSQQPIHPGQSYERLLESGELPQGARDVLVERITKVKTGLYFIRNSAITQRTILSPNNNKPANVTYSSNVPPEVLSTDLSYPDTNTAAQISIDPELALRNAYAVHENAREASND